MEIRYAMEAVTKKRAWVVILILGKIDFQKKIKDIL